MKIRKIFKLLPLFLINFYPCVFSSEPLTKLDQIEVVREESLLSASRAKRYTTKYGSFRFIEAPIKGVIWVTDKTVQGIGAVGSFLVDGIQYPFQYAYRKKSGGINHEKAEKS